ncbi:MAG: alkaline phosphatase family protein [Nitrospira sp.]|nr:alkaline phosphatase family protein [Nitrospira sp.]
MTERHLFIFIDSMGWEILKGQSFLDDLIQAKVPLKTPLGYSSAAVPTILSGRMPSQHGHWSFYFYSPQTSPFAWLRPLALIPAFIRERGRVRGVLSKVANKVLNFSGYFQLYNTPFQYIHLFDYCEKKDIFKSGGFNGGESIFDILKARKQSYFVSDWRQTDEVNLSETKKAFLNAEISFGFLYLTELDALIHRVGTKHIHVKEKIETYEKKIENLYKEISKKNKLNLHIFSDHGQADVHTTIDIIRQIETLGLKFGKDYVAYYDSTMARFWFLKPISEMPIRNALGQIHEGEILVDSELKKLGAFWHDHRFGDLVFLMKPGVLIVPSFMGKTSMAAMHGYHPDDPSADAVYMSTQIPSLTPEHIADIFSLMVKSLSMTI